VELFLLVPGTLPGSDLGGEREKKKSDSHELKYTPRRVITVLCKPEEKPINMHLQSSTSSSDSVFSLPVAVNANETICQKAIFPFSLLQHVF